MSKSKNASFSSVDKSNLQVFKEKFKEKNGNQKSKTSTNGKNAETEKKKKRNFLFKWLTSVRGIRSGPETPPPHMASNGLEGSVDFFEIPIGPKENISKILIKPTEKGLKAVYSKYYCSMGSEELYSNKGEDSYEMGDEARFRGDFKSLSQSPTTNTPLLNNTINENTQKFERLLTSALFIRKNLDRMVERTVSMKTSLPRHHCESKSSNEINQKYINPNNVHLSYKNVRRGKDQVIRTFKTTSEPTWEERQKIINRQGFRDNLNYLVKEFMSLDRKEGIDFSKFENRFPLKKQYNEKSKTSSRGVSREVSPEILVNIKPFKENVSQDFINYQSLKTIKSSKKFDYQSSNRLMKVSDGIKGHPGENYGRHGFKSAVISLHNNNEENFRGVQDIVVSLAPVKNKLNWNKESAETKSDENSFRTSGYPSLDKRKTCSTDKSLLQTKEELRNSSIQPPDENKIGRRSLVETEDETLRDSKSLDEILSSLNDEDHDLIFKKNMSQFKKKIPVVPRFDLKKPNKKGLIKSEEKVWRKLTWLKNPLEIEKLNLKKAEKVADFSLQNSWEKKIEMCRSECLDLQKNLLNQKPEKILENIFLMLCESPVINRILATRVESKAFSFRYTFREIHDMQEKNIAVVIRIENPTDFNRTLRKIELFNMDDSNIVRKPLLSKPREGETIAMYLCVNRDAIPYDLISICGGAGETSPCYLENLQFLFDFDERFLQLIHARQSLQFRLKKQSLKELLSDKFVKCLNEIKTKEGGGNKEANLSRKTTTAQVLAKVSIEISCKSILILNQPSYNYAVRVFEKPPNSFNLKTKSYSESDLHRTDERTPKLDESKKEVRKSERQEMMPLPKDSSVCPDGFNVLYSNGNENLNYDNESVNSSSRLTERSSNLFRTANKDGDKEIWKEKDKTLVDPISQELSGMLNCKSNSSTKETILQRQFSSEKLRLRRPHISVREMEKTFPDLVRSKEKLMHLCEREQTESGPKTERKLSTLSIPKQMLLGRQENGGKRKVLLLKKKGTNLKKELVAAVNVIKNMSPCAGEVEKKNKQVSLVIMLSKN